MGQLIIVRKNGRVVWGFEAEEDKSYIETVLDAYPEFNRFELDGLRFEESEYQPHVIVFGNQYVIPKKQKGNWRKAPSVVVDSYLCDTNSPVHICSITPSYEAYWMGVIADIDMDEEDEFDWVKVTEPVSYFQKPSGVHDETMGVDELAEDWHWGDSFTKAHRRMMERLSEEIRCNGSGFAEVEHLLGGV